MKSISNVDTIYFLVYFEKYEDSKNITDFLLTLKEEKEKASLAATNDTSYKHIIPINGMSFQLLPNGTRGYSYIIRNNGYEIKIAQYTSGIKSFAPVQVRISSEYLWSLGLKDSYNLIYNWLTESFDNIKEIKVSRVDLATHIDNTDFISNYDTTYKGSFKKSEIYKTHNKINAISFGSRKSGTYCRIYNKSLEIQENTQKQWFIEIWKNNSLDVENVWNVEFELKSEILRNFNILSVDDLLNHISSLWQYCTKEWLIKVDRTNKRIERCEITDSWKYLQNTFNNFYSAPLTTREKQINSDAKSMIPVITGYLTTYGARIGEIDLNTILQDISKESIQYLKNKNTTLQEVIINKIPQVYDCEVDTIV